LVENMVFTLRPCSQHHFTPSADSLFPARSALAGLCLRLDSFRRFPSGEIQITNTFYPSLLRKREIVSGIRFLLEHLDASC